MIKDTERLTQKVITVRVFDNSDQIFQDVFAYLTEVEPRIWQAVVKMPLLVTPSDICADLLAAMDDNDIQGSLTDKITFTTNFQLI